MKNEVKIFTLYFAFSGLLLVPALFLCNTRVVSAEEYYVQGNTLSLDEAIRIALDNNHQVKAETHELRSRRWEVNLAKSMMLPRISLDMGYTRVDNGTVRRGNVFTEVGRELVRQFAPDQDPNDIRPGAWADMFSTSLSLTQPIYNGGKEFANLSMSRALERSASLVLLDTKGNTILQVKERYYQTLKAAELVRLMEETLTSSREHRHNAEKLEEAGLRSHTDVLRLEVKESSDEGLLLDAQNGLSISKRLLEETLAVRLPPDIELAPPIEGPREPEFSLETAISEALRKHPSLRSMDAQVDASDAGVSLAWSEFLPQVNLVYNLSWETNNTIDLDSFHFWSAGFTMRLPLFNSFGDWAELQRSKAQLNRFRELREGTKTSVETAVTQAYLDVVSSVKKWKAAGKGEEHATENLKSIRKKYEVGLVAHLDLLDAQVAYTNAVTSSINALYDHYIAVARLEQSMGQLDYRREGL